MVKMAIYCYTYCKRKNYKFMEIFTVQIVAILSTIWVCLTFTIADMAIFTTIIFSPCASLRKLQLYNTSFLRLIAQKLYFQKPTHSSISTTVAIIPLIVTHYLKKKEK